MNKPALQQRLTQHSGLLDSQRQLLQRLLLQLEFNRPDRLQLIGGSGSGKSTLMLALAEISSEHFNLSLVQCEATMSVVDLLKVMQQHWFGAMPLPRTLPDFLAQLHPEQAFLLALDNADVLSDECWQVVQQLPVTVFISVLQPKADIRLAMHLLPVTEQELRFLLKPYSLSERDVFERVDECAGDLHLLFVGLSRNPVTRSFKASESRQDVGFSADFGDEDEPSLGDLAKQGESSKTSKSDPLGLRAVRVEQEQAEPLFTEPRSRQASASTKAAVQASSVSGQFFSPFLVMSLGFCLIAAVVMFWLWSEQQFRKPISTDLVPYYPNTSVNPSAAERLASSSVSKTLPVASTDDVQQKLESVKTQANTAVGTLERTVFRDEMPQMALPRQEPVISLPDESLADGAQDESEPTPLESESSREPVSELNETEDLFEATTAQPEIKPAAVAAEPSVESAPVKAPVVQLKGPVLDEKALQAMLADTVAIQLGVFSQLGAARGFVQKYPALNLHIYQRSLNAKTQFVVVSASYVNGNAAREQVKKLPQELRQQTPFVKSLSDIQQEIQNFASQ